MQERLEFSWRARRDSNAGPSAYKAAVIKFSEVDQMDFMRLARPAFTES